MLKVTLDSNVYISAFQFGGAPLLMLDMATDGEIELALSDAIINEVARVLYEKFEASPERLAEVRAVMGRIARRVMPTRTLDVVPSDPDDNRILECAVEAASDCVLTGDSDLLRLGKYRGIPIIKVRHFLQQYNGFIG